MLRQLLFPEVSSQLTLKQQVQSQVPQLFPILRAIATIVIVCLGTLFFGQIGSLAYPLNGAGAVLGCTFGVTVCLFIGCCATGSWRDFLMAHDTTTQGLILPHTLASQIGGHGYFDLLVTVHKAVSVEVQGQMPWSPLQIYAEVECGSNPVKRTCVRPDGRFEEQFKLNIEAVDRSMLVRLKNQGMLGTVDVGYVHVDIQSDIVDADSLRQRAFEINAGEGDSLRWTKPRAQLILSFELVGARGASGFPNPFETTPSKDPESLRHGGQSYGAVDFISRLEFNPDARLEYDQDAFRTR